MAHFGCVSPFSRVITRLALEGYGRAQDLTAVTCHRSKRDTTIGPTGEPPGIRLPEPLLDVLDFKRTVILIQRQHQPRFASRPIVGVLQSQSSTVRFGDLTA